MDSRTVGATIAELRREKGMTQSELASALSVSSQAVSKWENGRGFPDVVLFPKMAKIFGVSIEYLMTYEPKEP